MFTIRDDSSEGKSFLETVITNGAVRLVESSTSIRIADRIHEQVLLERLSDILGSNGADDEILSVLAHETIIRKAVSWPDHSSKGFIMESAGVVGGLTRARSTRCHRRGGHD